MAVVYRTSAAGGGTSSTTDRTAVITPAVGDLFIVFCSAAVNTNVTPTCSDDNGGTYTRIGASLFATSANTLSAFVRNQLLINTTSTTVTVATGSNTSAEIVIVAVSGMYKVGSAAIRSSGTQANQATGTTPAPALNQAALTGHVTIGAVGNGTTPATLTAPTNWTERQDVGQSTPSIGLEVVTRDSGFTGTTVTWGGTSPTAFASFIVELDASQGVPITKGTFSLTGNSTGFKIGMPVTKGTFSLTGNSTGFKIGMPVTKGTFALTGNGTGFKIGMPVTKGTFNLTGNNTNFSVGYIMPVTKGTFSLTGNTTNFKIAMPVTKGTFSLTGNDVIFTRTLVPSPYFNENKIIQLDCDVEDLDRIDILQKSSIIWKDVRDSWMVYADKRSSRRRGGVPISWLNRTTAVPTISDVLGSRLISYFTDNYSAGTWTDDVGGALMTQATAGFQPTAGTLPRGGLELSFDGVDDRLFGQWSSTNPTGGYRLIFFIGSCSSASTSRQPWLRAGTGFGQGIGVDFNLVGDNHLWFQASGGGSYDSGGNYRDDTRHRIVCIEDSGGGTSSYSVDGSTLALAAGVSISVDGGLNAADARFGTNNTDVSRLFGTLARVGFAWSASPFTQADVDGIQLALAAML